MIERSSFKVHLSCKMFLFFSRLPDIIIFVLEHIVFYATEICFLHVLPTLEIQCPYLLRGCHWNFDNLISIVYIVWMILWVMLCYSGVLLKFDLRCGWLRPICWFHGKSLYANAFIIAYVLWGWKLQSISATSSTTLFPLWDGVQSVMFDRACFGMLYLGGTWLSDGILLRLHHFLLMFHIIDP